MKKETGFESIAKERIEQVVKHRQTLAKDRGYKKGQLVDAAIFCLTGDKRFWPRGWNSLYRKKIENKSLEERYVIAGAFIAAEVDRLREINDWSFSAHVDVHADWDKLKSFIERMESESRHHHSGSLLERACSVINHANGLAAQAVAQKKQCIDDMKTYVRGMCMSVEMVAIAQTHGEKNARLRGFIELLNSTSSKLNDGYEDEILRGWRFETYGNSDLPYQSILRKYGELKRENEELKKKLNPDTEKKEETDEYPF